MGFKRIKTLQRSGIRFPPEINSGLQLSIEQAVTVLQSQQCGAVKLKSRTTANIAMYCEDKVLMLVIEDPKLRVSKPWP